MSDSGFNRHLALLVALGFPPDQLSLDWKSVMEHFKPFLKPVNISLLIENSWL
jgi:hypothetical protein